MDPAKAQAIFEELSSLDGQEAVTKLRGELWRAAVRYADLRVRWVLIPEERAEIDPVRTRAHNTVIDCCNALSRAMARAGLSTEWRKVLGDESTREGRKVIGDFASMVHYKIGISGR